jgi:hypothetical protein
LCSRLSSVVRGWLSDRRSLISLCSLGEVLGSGWRVRRFVGGRQAVSVGQLVCGWWTVAVRLGVMLCVWRVVVWLGGK